MSAPNSFAISICIFLSNILLLMLNTFINFLSVAAASAEPPPIPEAIGNFLFKFIFIINLFY